VLADANAGAAFDAIRFPTTVNVPVELFWSGAPAPVPEVVVPVKFISPVEAFATTEDAPVPAPATSPVMFIIPVLLFVMQFLAVEALELPIAFPVIVSVPVPKFATATVLADDPPEVTTPTMDAELAPVNSTQFPAVALLFVTFAVSVTLFAKTNFPVPAFETSSQVVLTLIVTVCPVAARASSPVVGTTPPVHVAPAEKFPLAAEVIRAMAYSPFAVR
jgi:hypothetical protein